MENRKTLTLDEMERITGGVADGGLDEGALLALANECPKCHGPNTLTIIQNTASYYLLKCVVCTHTFKYMKVNY